ncbi:PREDICTED: uncharacterized protein LOC106320504 [Brassica oleracea var. oleracea]|uniref:uncharacterized protein LOC106320504 n=1 Tax=Brassica oleracea var. oleracea TaxID=109376 RepID=UPI0006A6A0EB|nr:PREDICTED: uncharacterized protein LOC106320504 [Brassica oleracea var. oleracea]
MEYEKHQCLHNCIYRGRISALCFSLAKSVRVSIGVFGGTWRPLESKREWKVLFERVEHRSGQREQPTTPAPDETKSERRPAAGLGSRSEPNSSSITFESWSDQDGARSVTSA